MNTGEFGTLFLSGKENEWKKPSTPEDIKGLIELLEASYLGLESENILEEVTSYAINFLKGSSKSLNSPEVSKQMVHHALGYPSHWRVEWFQVKQHIKDFEKTHNNHYILLELAKLNFNNVQANLQNEVKELSRYVCYIWLKKFRNISIYKRVL